MTLSELKREIIALLWSSGCKEAKSDASALICDCLDIRPSDFALYGQVPDEMCNRIRSWAQERANGRPVQYITGKAPFMDFIFYVREGVLIPRGDTERLVECALKAIEAVPGAHVADLCSGSGCIGLSIAKYRPDADLVLVDISEDAVETAQRNARELGLSGVKVKKADIAGIDMGRGRFDLIVSNPPYIPSGDMELLDPVVRDNEPRIALDGGEDGLDFYRLISKRSRLWLRRGGILMYEVGAGQRGDVESILSSQGYSGISWSSDYGGIERVVWGRA